MPLYPVFLDLSGKKCVVIGGGKIAERKVCSILECKGSVLLVSPESTENLKKMSAEGLIRYVPREYCSLDLEEAFLVICATSNKITNSKVALDCMERNILVNVVDDPQGGNFLVPATLRRGDLSICVSTEGKSPALAKRIRQELEATYGHEYARFLDVLGQMREKIIETVPDAQKRYEIFNRLVAADILNLIKTGQDQLVKERIEQCISL